MNCRDDTKRGEEESIFPTSNWIFSRGCENGNRISACPLLRLTRACYYKGKYGEVSTFLQFFPLYERAVNGSFAKKYFQGHLLQMQESRDISTWNDDGLSFVSNTSPRLLK